MKTFLLEIGSEEIPARFIPKGLQLLREGITSILHDGAVEFGEIQEIATPRRLAILISNVAEHQRDREQEVTGPPRKIAFDEKGNPTPAAAGFARSMNIDVDSLRTRQTRRGEYVIALVRETGRPTTEILAEALPVLISSLQLPKSMRWGNGTLRYFRPIHWILALFGSDVVSFELDGIRSSNITYGHRFLSPAAMTIQDPSSYLQSLRHNHVVADPAERQAIIIKDIREIEEKTDCLVIEDRDLLETVVNLVEFPHAVLGHFENHFLELPKELLTTVMKIHQKYFGVTDKEGRLLSSFILISNTARENADTVRAGAERVLRARLGDAEFYFREDRQRPLTEYVKKLKKVTFQDKLGSLYDKVTRISSVCTFLASQLGLPADDKLARAVSLCKADLVTGVVGEFPELQGYIGMIYAIQSGEERDVAAALYEHYLPRYPGDALPSGELGTVISLADRMDTIASFFSLGQTPTGSEDPFALRRHATAIINILQESNHSLRLELLIDASLQNLSISDAERTDIARKILQFFHIRLEGIFQSAGCTYDTINSILPGSSLDIKDIKKRLDIIGTLKKTSGFPEFLTAAKRVCNILQSAQHESELDEALLTEPSEKALSNTIATVGKALDHGDYESLFQLTSPVNAFFDGVLVMDKDPGIRANRLALLSSVKKLLDTLGDFSKISV